MSDIIRTTRSASNSSYTPKSLTAGSHSSFGSSSDFQHGSPEYYNYNVRTSEAYHIAYDLFSPLTDKQWLTRLESIASGSAVGAPSWTDDLGLSQDYQKRQIEAYNTAIGEINDLINSYYEHVNTLPVTQVQQAADAGVNLAASGDISGSSMSSQPSNRSQLSGEGTNSTGLITGAVSAVSSVVSSLSSVYKSVQDVKIARDNLKISSDAQNNDKRKFLSGFWKNLSDSGFDVSGFSFDDWSDLDSFFSSVSNDPEYQRRVQESLVSYIKSDYSNHPILSKFTDPSTGEYVGADMVPRFMEILGVDSISDFDKSMDLFANYEMQTLLLDKLTAFNTAVYNENKSAVLDGSDAGLAENASNSFTKVNSNLSEIKAQINSEFIQSFAEQWHKNKTPESRFALLKMVTNMNLDDQSAYELIQLLGSPTLAKGADQVITELVKAGGNIANKLYSFFDRKQNSKRR